MAQVAVPLTDPEVNYLRALSRTSVWSDPVDGLDSFWIEDVYSAGEDGFYGEHEAAVVSDPELSRIMEKLALAVSNGC